ncbi:four helix bundle protein [Chryseobacterium sp. Ch-15]|uniref:Four helix bundle protein n=1 Tax=Chryseobacterium muglaense TaxID=2893752 RepID=A0A9Q3UT70_9FLAO|nr:MULTISPECIES: four helix bundle protein [Chryseobacterium]MBD3903598.1 four helix bundle protein [Chryseobacterium muglaense]MBO6184388.1 four helix bundle protein [Chryseobacterium sp.]MCC9034669.1 four helix bundle protein [Chryseobacterium muglaense]MCM2552932.1 four helix bundle protein [Chryseobacterium muglaense]
MDFNQIFRNRTKNFSLSIIKLLSPLPYSDAVSVIRKQIIRSATSVAANYRAVSRARSDKERFAKICIVVEEIDETQLWLEIIEELEYVDSEKLLAIKSECEELVKVMTTYKFKLSQNI